MDKNHDLLVTTINKCKTFCGVVLINGYVDPSKTSHNYTRQKVLSLLIGAEVTWNDCFLKSPKTKQVSFKRTNSKGIEEDWTFTMY